MCIRDRPCTVSESADVCVYVCGGGTGRLTGCTLSEGEWGGLHVDGAGTKVHATNCHFVENRKGAASFNGATLTAVACESSHNSATGFSAFGQGSIVELTRCSSGRDEEGCRVSDGAVLRATSEGDRPPRCRA